MKDKKIWINWKYEKDKKGKLTKVPYQPNGLKASSTDSKTWYTYNEVKKAKGISGIGIILGTSTKLVGIDLDHVIPIKNPYVQDFLTTTDTYVEYSPSKTGLHAIYVVSDIQNVDLPVKKVPAKNKDKYGQFEVYKDMRFFTFTEDVYGEHDKIKTVTSEQFKKELAILGYPWGYKPPENTVNNTTSTSTLSDEEVKSVMLKRASNSIEVKKLWDGDITKYNNDYSSAEMALCSTLAFYTNKDAEQIRRLWLQSPLAQREKTQKRKDYQDRTIQNAIASCTNVFAPKKKKEYVDGNS